MQPNTLTVWSANHVVRETLCEMRHHSSHAIGVAKSVARHWGGGRIAQGDTIQVGDTRMKWIFAAEFTKNAGQTTRKK